MRAVHCLQKGNGGKSLKDVTIADPTPAVLCGFAVPEGFAGGGICLKSIIFVPAACGMIRGKFSGLEKNEKTVSIGKGTHCSNSRWLAIELLIVGRCIQMLRPVRNCANGRAG